MREFKFSVPGPEGKPVEYYGHTLPYREGLALGAELGDLVGSMLGGGRGLGGVITGLASTIIAKGGPDFIARIMDGVSRDGVKLTAADGDGFEVYADNYGELVIALSHVLKERFGSFFGERVREHAKEVAAKYVGAMQSGGLQKLWEVPTAPTSMNGSSPTDST